MGRRGSEDKSADVRQVSHAAGLYLRDGAGCTSAALSLLFIFVYLPFEFQFA